ncbi:hypothetical protein GRS48_06570 [Halorubrum sp. JWXQ-INN 858]|uniref:restriction endonuclease subunit S n=1 Tax=Halorubrum sp. JWXQ-INN 858 TaxID=2690782 RepID=UPI00135CB8BA|nr:restriction endonuclease subunit S [Halorubrum sp. JWXQ-INN 858]MWV64488.1 hypothetical protein [Halorubrum sp. JWXQ-INN 858]
MNPEQQSLDDLSGESEFHSQENVKLEDVCEFMMRGKHPDYVDSSNIRVLNQKALRWDEINEEHLKFHNPNTDMFKNRFLSKGDIVINSTGVGTLGRVYLFREDPEKIFADSHITILRTNENVIIPEYLYYLLRSPHYQDEIQNIAVGSTGQIELNKRALAKLEISFPPVEIQKRIIDYLGPIDEKMGINKKINTNLGEIVQHQFKRRFVDYEPYDVFKDSEKGKIPSDFRVGKLPELMEIVLGGTPKSDVEEYYGGDILWAKAKDVSQEKDPFVSSTEKAITEKGLSESSAELIPEGTTIITARGTVGEIALTPVEMTTNQTCYGLVPQNRKDKYFLYFLVESHIRRLRSRTHGTVFDTINMNTLREQEVVIPPEEERFEFNSNVEPTLELIKQNQEESKSLRQLRDTLLPKLMSGEIRVDDIKLDELEVDSKV